MEWKKINKLIPKELKDEFRNHLYKAIEKFDIKYELTIMEKLEEIEEEFDNESLKNYLKKQLFTQAEKDIQYKEANYKDINETIEYCKQTLRFIDCEKNKCKKYYFNLGKALFEISKNYDVMQIFIKDMEEKLERKKSAIYNYLSFYNICLQNVDLIDCSLTFEEIIKHKKILFQLNSK